MPVSIQSCGELRVDPAGHPRGLSFLSAASGLVRAAGRLYVVGDDEHHLGVFDAAAGPGATGRLLRLLPGDLPADATRRKARKPDLEALLLLPAWGACPHGALLALGSGSKPNRHVAVLLPLDETGATGAPRVLDLQPLYAPLHAACGDLNIEGGFIMGGELNLLQRGHQARPVNARIHLGWEHVRAWLDGARDPVPVLGLQTIDLGRAEGAALCFTDGAPWPAVEGAPEGAWVFTAVAENTTDSYRDGSCVAAVFGVAGADGRVHHAHRLPKACKVEGIDARGDGAHVDVLMVTDADDPQVPSRFLSARLHVDGTATSLSSA